MQIEQPPRHGIHGSNLLIYRGKTMFLDHWLGSICTYFLSLAF